MDFRFWIEEKRDHSGFFNPKSKMNSDWPWSSVHDYTGRTNRAPATPSGLAVDRVLLPADEHTRI
ncbi:MAG: hypothetical protein ACLQOO_31370 [Terriglobia bacterium]